MYIDNRNHPNYYTPKNAFSMLTENKYFCRVPRIYIYSPDELKYYGIPVDEINGRVNKNSKFDLVDSYLSIMDFIKIASENSPVIIKERDKIKEIYQIAKSALEILTRTPQVQNYEELIENLEIFINKLEEENSELIYYQPTVRKGTFEEKISKIDALKGIMKQPDIRDPNVKSAKDLEKPIGFVKNKKANTKDLNNTNIKRKIYGILDLDDIEV